MDFFTSLNALDIVIIVIMLIFIISGFARGFLSSLLKLFSSVVSLAIAVWLAKPVAVFIDGIVNMNSWFADKIAAAFSSMDAFFNLTVGVDFPGGAPGADITGAILKDEIANGVSSIGAIFKTALNFFIQDNATITNGTVLKDWFGQLLGGIAALIVAAVLIFIAIRIVVAILSKVFDAITKNAAIGGLDRLLGLALGAAKGALVIAVMFAIYSVVSVVPGVEAATSSIIDGSVIGKPVYDYVSEFVVSQIGQIDFNAIIQSLFNSITA
ncbi:MAG: CvpA family protein [Spirochaetales bacterium]